MLEEIYCVRAIYVDNITEDDLKKSYEVYKLKYDKY